MDNVFRVLRENYKGGECRISQRKLAGLIGIAAPHISELENGRMPSTAELRAYHNFFRVSYEYLLGETDMPVSTDVFRDRPVTERQIESTLRWLNESRRKDEIDIRNTIEYLLGDARGLVFLFYINAYRHRECSDGKLVRCLEELQKEEYGKYSFTELQIAIKNKLDSFNF